MSEFKTWSLQADWKDGTIRLYYGDEAIINVNEIDQQAARIAALEALVREFCDAYALEAGEGSESPDGLVTRARQALGEGGAE